MTKAHEIRDLIAEQSSGPGERNAIEAVADRLDEALAQEVPYRPEFKAQLRRRLITEGRRTLAPWYRRPAVWGSSLAMAAAVGILAVGLQLWQAGPGPTPNPPSPTDVGPRPNPPIDLGPKPRVIPRVVNDLVLPAPTLADELLSPSAAGPEPVAGADWADGLRLYLLSMRPDADQFTRIAQGLGFTQPAQATTVGFQAVEGSRTLQLTATGEVDYADALSGGGVPADEAGAQAIARRFLERAGLPIPSQPEIYQGEQQQLLVTYTPRVDNRPIINERTVIQVGAGNQIARAIAFVQGSRETRGRYEAIPPEEAINLAQQRGGQFDQADLVYVRTQSDQAVYLQPYWRVYGTNQAGSKVARYVPALSR